MLLLVTLVTAKHWVSRELRNHDLKPESVFFIYKGCQCAACVECSLQFPFLEDDCCDCGYSFRSFLAAHAGCTVLEVLRAVKSENSRYYYDASWGRYCKINFRLRSNTTRGNRKSMLIKLCRTRSHRSPASRVHRSPHAYLNPNRTTKVLGGDTTSTLNGTGKGTHTAKES